MSEGATAASRGASPFSKGGVLGIVLIGFIAFIALLYFLGAGDTGDDPSSGSAHASATGLDGYAALARMLEAEDYDVEVSRTPSDLETSGLLILTPPLNADPEELGRILQNREYIGPTLVILPKWLANRPGYLPGGAASKFKEGWVELSMPIGPSWTEDLPGEYSFPHSGDTRAQDDEVRWIGMSLAGKLPTPSVAYTEESEDREALISDADGNVLAFSMSRGGAPPPDDSDYYSNEYYGAEYWTVFVVEPDLMNNYGMSDAARAEAALELVEYAGYGDVYSITLDMTLNGFGGSENLLTLAFRPPFLAATLCLILAILIVGWRAFLRFGPAAARGPEIAFGKKQLVKNGAGLIVRGNRFGLLAEPFAELSARRIAQQIGIAKPDPEAIDAAIAVRLPDEEPFSLRANKLRSAQSPTDILRAAQALRELEGKLAK